MITAPMITAPMITASTITGPMTTGWTIEPAQLASSPDQAWIDRVQAALSWWTVDGWRLTGLPEPTSQVLGTGAVRVAEALFAARWSGQAVMTASNTAGTFAVLHGLGISGCTVLVQPMLWPSTLALVEALGAHAVLLPGEPGAAIGPAEVTSAVGRVHSRGGGEVRAVITQYHPGHDYRAIRATLARAVLVEDAATAPAAPEPRVAGMPHLAVFSFGPGKAIDIGEGGMITTFDPDLHDTVLSHAVHPARRGPAVIPEPRSAHQRPHPLAAVLLAHALETSGDRPRQVPSIIRERGVPGGVR